LGRNRRRLRKKAKKKLCETRGSVKTSEVTQGRGLARSIIPSQHPMENIIDTTGFNQVVKGKHGYFVYNPNDFYVGRAIEVYGEYSELETALFQNLIQGFDYRLYWHLPTMFNPQNYAEVAKNIYENIVSINMLCVHRDANLVIRGVEEITDSSLHPMNPYTKNPKKT